MKLSDKDKLISILKVFSASTEIVVDEEKVYLKTSAGIKIETDKKFVANFTTIRTEYRCWSLVDKNGAVVYNFRNNYIDLFFISDYLLLAKKLFFDEHGQQYTKATVINFEEKELLPYVDVDAIIFEEGFFYCYKYIFDNYDEYDDVEYDDEAECYKHNFTCIYHHLEYIYSSNGRLLSTRDFWWKGITELPPSKKFTTIISDTHAQYLDSVNNVDFINVFDSYGNPIFPPSIFDDCYCYKSLCVVVCAIEEFPFFYPGSSDLYLNKCGLFNSQGKMLLPYIFDEINIGGETLNLRFRDFKFKIPIDNLSMENVLNYLENDCPQT